MSADPNISKEDVKSWVNVFEFKDEEEERQFSGHPLTKE